MSRIPINEEIYNLGSHLKRGMESVIIDHNRMRVPFGSGTNGPNSSNSSNSKMPKRQSWMTVPSNQGVCSRPIADDPLPEINGLYDVVMEIPKQSRAIQQIQQIQQIQPISEPTGIEVSGWLLAVGYATFGLSLGLCNLLTPQHTSKVCTGMSPIPLLCLLLQALVCMDSDKREIWFIGPGCLIISASILPAACIIWSLYLAVPLMLMLSLSVFYCMRHRAVLPCVCLAGVCLSLLLALPAPIQILEPRWGMTVGIFFLCILCFLAGLGAPRVGIQIKTL